MRHRFAPIQKHRNVTTRENALDGAVIALQIPHQDRNIPEPSAAADKGKNFMSGNNRLGFRIGTFRQAQSR